MTTPESLIEQLRQVRYPGFSRDIVSFGLIKRAAIENDLARVVLAITTSDDKIVAELEAHCRTALQGLEGIRTVDIQIEKSAPPAAALQAGPSTQTPLPGIGRIIAVASGKGGVGKSTVAANLACAFHALGWRTGLCDCDIYGPSMSLMFGTREQPEMTDEDRIMPVEAHGIRLMSMGLLVDPASPAILRGPMVTRYTQQFLRGVEWGELDLLVLDLPPGTGDIQLTIAQTLSLSGAVLVTTPQEVALIDVRKAAGMFQKVSIPLLGIIENMSYFLCPNDGNRYAIFGENGGASEARRLGIPLLAQVPLEMSAREAGDQGKPVVLSKPHSEAAGALIEAARKLQQALA